MAVTRLSDVIVPEVFLPYMFKATMEKAAVFRSGVVTVDAKMSSLLSGGGRLYNHPYFRDLANAEPFVGNDDPADKLVPDKIGTAKLQFVRQLRTYGWSTMDLTAELAGADPMAQIAARTGDWWARFFNRLTIAGLSGIVAANVANNSGDMVHDITARTGTVVVGGATVPAFNLHAGAIIEAAQTMGDEKVALKLIVMHSRIYANLLAQDLIAFSPNSDGKMTIPNYMGYQVLETDTLVPTVSGADLIYSTYLVGSSVFGFGEHAVENPVATDRDEYAGKGTGSETLILRRQFALHPYGHNWTDASCAGEFPTTAEFQTAANWARSWSERKMFPIAVIKSKNG